MNTDQRKAPIAPSGRRKSSKAADEAGINPKWRWHRQMLLRVRERLREARGEKLADAAQPLEPHSIDIADTATDEFDHDMALAHLSAEQDALYEVDQALARIAAGTYGLCEATGEEIAPERLRAVPWTRFCRDAQTRLEELGAIPSEHLGEAASLHAPPQVFATGDEPVEPSEAEDENLTRMNVPIPSRKRKRH